MIRQLIRKMGVDIVRYPYRYIHQRTNIQNVLRENRYKLIENHGVDLVLDVGANEGHYAVALRKNGYKKRIVSFEPLAEPFLKLKAKAGEDRLWDVHNIALGHLNETAEINVAGNSESSSILEMEKIHLENAPESGYLGKQRIQIRRLGDFLDDFQSYKKIYLKVDVQGYERQVFEGLGSQLSKIDGVQIEMSLVELYKGETTFFDHSQFLLSAGFKLMSLEPGFFNSRTGQLLQVDGVWYRSRHE